MGGRVIHKAFASLCNFEIQGSVQEIRLGDVLIKPNPPSPEVQDPNAILKEDLSAEVRDWAAAQLKLAGYIDQKYRPRYKMDVDLEKADMDLDFFSRGRDAFERVLTILRLFKPGRVVARKVAEDQLTLRGDTAFDRPITDLECFRYRGDSYVLRGDEISLLQELHSQLGHVDFSPFEIAIRRFNDSYLRRDDVDRFIDQVVAFEALFSEGPGDLMFKISLRCAVFIGRDTQEKQRVRKTVKEAYVDRSQVLHGSTDRVSERQKIEELESYLRRSIVRFLSLAGEGTVLKAEELDEFLFLAEE